MQVTFKVFRHDLQANGKPSYQSYSLELEEDATILDALLQIRDEQDSTLSFRGTCRSGFCGDCTLQVNDKGSVACRTTLAKALKKAKDGEIKIDPLYPSKAQKDLMYDQDFLLFDKYKAVKPWLEPAEPLPEREHLVSNEVTRDLRKVMSCTMCGLCDQGCLVIVVDESYIGPAALTKAYRVIKDPRTTNGDERLKLVSGTRKLWDCTHCFEANSHCPKDIDPTDRIFALRDMAIKEGLGPRKVANHYKSFAASVKADGWLDETRLAIETEGLFNIAGQLKQLPIGLRALRRRKAPKPYFLHKKRPSAERVRRIFEKWEEKK